MSVASATRTELRKLKKLTSVEGQAAVMLAEAMDSQTSLMAAPAMAKQLIALLQPLRDAAPKVEDEVDALRKRRADRGAAPAKKQAARRRPKA